MIRDRVWFVIEMADDRRKRSTRVSDNR